MSSFDSDVIGFPHHQVLLLIVYILLILVLVLLPFTWWYVDTAGIGAWVAFALEMRRAARTSVASKPTER